MSLHAGPTAGLVEPQVSQLPPDVVEQLVGRWNGEPGSARFLQEGTNSIYQFRGAGRDLILRVHHTQDRTPQLIAAELDWVDFLYRHGVAVAPPVPAATGERVQIAECKGKKLYAVVFRRVPGVNASLHDGKRWRTDLVRHLGRILGRMHGLNRSYRPTPGEGRFDWPSIDLPRFAESVTPAEDLAYMTNLRAYWQWIQSLPREAPGSFGLVHGDFQSANLLVRKSRATVIDFDASCYNWYLCDVAQFVGVSMLAVWSDDPDRRRADAETLFRELMRGYLKEHQLGSEWVARFPEFLRGFCLLYYFNILARFHFDPPLGKEAPHYRIVRSVVLDGRPFLDLDFERLHQEAKRSRFLPAWSRWPWEARRR